MKRRASGSRGVMKRYEKNRVLDDELRPGLGLAEDGAQRRHTASGPSHEDDENTPTRYSFRAGTHDIKSLGASASSISYPDTFPSTARRSGQQSGRLVQPNKSPGSTAGPLGASTASGVFKDTASGSPGGMFSGLSRPTLKQSPLANGLPSLSSTSSDASSIPARSTGILPETSFHSLKFGHGLADRAAAGEDRSRQSYNPERVATGRQQRRQPSPVQDDILPAPPNRKRRRYGITLSDDGSLSGESDENVDDNNDENALFSLSKIHQRSGRPKAHGSDGHLPADRFDGGFGKKKTKEAALYDRTPSGKDYHSFLDEDGQTRTAYSVFFPDNWSLRTVSGLTGLHYFCPVRTCQQYFERVDQLTRHFRTVHKGFKFNDNLDDEGTLEIVGPTAPGASSIVVSQNPRCPPVHAHRRPHAPLKSRSEVPVNFDTAGSGLNGYGTVLAVREAAKSSSRSQDVDASAPKDAGKDHKASTSSSELDLAMAESRVWAYIDPLVPKSWSACFSNDVETTAFIQAISLPLRNNIDKEWLQGTKNSHQRTYRSLMSVIFQIIGMQALCKPCESRTLERRRNCKALPSQAEGMRELQQVFGSQCTNCYFFPSAHKPCEFPTTSTRAIPKQTPVPLPTQVTRPQNFDPSSSAPALVASAHPSPVPASGRPSVPSYSQYKATKADKQISESPIPIPSFATQRQSSQRQSSHSSNDSLEESKMDPVRRSRRLANAGGESRSSFQSILRTDEVGFYPATSTASKAEPLGSTLITTGSIPTGLSNKHTAEATSNLPSNNAPDLQLMERVFSLFGDISRIAAEDEKAALLGQIQQMATMLQTGTVTNTSTTNIPVPRLPPGSPPTAEEWEIGPGRLTMDDMPLAFSTSYLGRESVTLTAAQRFTPTQSVLNKTISPLHQLRVGPEDCWLCSCSVMRGVLKMKIGDVQARIGPGGVFAIKRECLITNVSHKEAKIQVWWMREDD